VIEIRPDGIEQIIQAQFKSGSGSEHLTPSRGGSLDSKTGTPFTPRVVACTKCHSRFAEGVRFCGRCGNRTFHFVDSAESTGSASSPSSAATVTCPRCKQEYPSTHSFCGKCGIPIGAQSLDWRQPRPVEVVCKLCGSSYAGGTKFCGRCGKPMSP
jgi:predicted amidophosphoribosyltransferase